jgi:hypothetical protein
LGIGAPPMRLKQGITNLYLAYMKIVYVGIVARIEETTAIPSFDWSHHFIGLNIDEKCLLIPILNEEGMKISHVFTRL